VLSGIVLSQWLQRRVGTVVAGASIRLSPSGLLRVSTTADSRQVQVMLPVLHGGQAAVARVVPPGAAGQPEPHHRLALRVQAISSDEERARQMDRLVAMLTVVEAARADPATYPAVLPVLESFTLSVPGTEITTTGSSTTDYELWCDVVAWLPTTLASHHTNTGPTARDPRTVAAQIFPVLTTVRAVHDNLGIVHRDITPSNVLVSPEQRLVLSDWSLAHAVGTDVTSTQTVVQPDLSLPPEMLTGDTSVGRYTDAWYLGSLLVWMLTGQPADPHGRPPEGLPPGPVGQRLATIAQGLCWPDPHQRMGLPEAVQRLTQPVDVPWVVPAARPPSTTAVRLPGEPPPPDAPSAQPDLPPRPLARKSHSLRTTITTILLGLATLIVGVAVGIAWNVSSRDQPTATHPPSPSTDPPDERYLFPSDEPTYPPFTGLNTLLIAFPLNPADDRPECTRVDPADYVPAGAQEVYRCAWSDLDVTLYLSRWEAGSQGFDTWRASTDGETVGDWGMIDWDEPRGSYLAWGEAPPRHYVTCYRDLPFCKEVLYPTQAELTVVEERIGGLDAHNAALMASYWPDVSAVVILPEPE